MDAACMKWLRALNEWLALKLSAGFSSMATFWAFNILTFVPLAFPSLLAIVQFISSGYLQLVALPLLAVSNALTFKMTEARAQQDHIAIMAEMEMLKSLLASQVCELKLLKEMQVEQHEILKLLRCSLEKKD